MKVLAAVTAGGIGDALAALPAVQALHRRFGAGVDFLTTPYAAPILEGQPAIAEVLTDDGRSSTAELAARLGERGYSHAVVFWSNPRISSIVRRAQIPVRVGQARRLYSYRYTVRVPVRTETGDRESHWTDVQMDYVRALGVHPQAADYQIGIPLSAADEADARRVLDGLQLRSRFVMLHAVRRISAQAPHWPVERFAALADALAEHYHAAVLLTGDVQERALVEGIRQRMTRAGFNVAGKSTLRGLAALAHRADVVVALDSGPMHVAAAVGAPTVGVFALRTDLPGRWRPLGKRVAVVEPSYPCPASCTKERCRTFACYAALPVDKIVAVACKLAPPALADMAL